MTGATAPVLILTGPTGSGKSEWAMRLAGQWPVEIISVDSAQVFRGMDIGTAKPGAAARAAVAHHLIDILDPAQTYSAGQFAQDAVALISQIRGRGHIPLLVGGTMLYLRALRQGLAQLPHGSPAIRQAIDAAAAQRGWPVLHAELARIDPLAASRIHPNDAQRIQRALEVCRLTGQTLSALQAHSPAALQEPAPIWALVPEPRALLHERLAIRFKQMMAQGFLEEVRALHGRGDLRAGHASMRAVGYRQLWQHCDGHMTLAEAAEQAVAATRQLAKRQLTWLRGDSSIRIVDPEAREAFAAWSLEVGVALSAFIR
ncbi:MAG TPA: tRNA (adenosine(37)-N6)-dimethylallyltransferase MiaA [Steroidobacteraceae bacterium]|jgi:tRNA dimethylallyltransferase|nr:tRNA (adenosine(37)-N6)-dimethylallyltransferase MiaA [Steroidobacteraceae bacterium]